MRIDKLSIIMPAYNERETILKIVGLVEGVDFGGRQIEIIIVDDGSTDGTREILKSLEDRHKIIYQPKNRGKGAAVREGIKAASGDYVITQDADLEYEPTDIVKLLEKAEGEQALAVYGSRRLGLARKKNPRAGWHYYLGGVLVTWTTNLLYGAQLTDEPTCYKLMKRTIFDRLVIESDRFNWEPEVTAKMLKSGVRILEIPIAYHPRTSAEGKKIKWKDGLAAIWTLVKYRF